MASSIGENQPRQDSCKCKVKLVKSQAFGFWDATKLEKMVQVCECEVAYINSLIRDMGLNPMMNLLSDSWKHASADLDMPPRK